MSVIYRNPGPITFDAKIQRTDGGGAFVSFPFDVENLFGVKGRVPVRVSFDGIPYRGSMVKMGSEKHLLLILKEIRETLGKDRGDKVHVTVELDDLPRVVVLAPDIDKAYKKGGVLDIYRSLSYSHQREYTLWIDDTKNPETRRKRIDKSIAVMKAAKATAKAKKKG